MGQDRRCASRHGAGRRRRRGRGRSCGGCRSRRPRRPRPRDRRRPAPPRAPAGRQAARPPVGSPRASTRMPSSAISDVIGIGAFRVQRLDAVGERRSCPMDRRRRAAARAVSTRVVHDGLRLHGGISSGLLAGAAGQPPDRASSRTRRTSSVRPGSAAVARGRSPCRDRWPSRHRWSRRNRRRSRRPGDGRPPRRRPGRAAGPRGSRRRSGRRSAADSRSAQAWPERSAMSSTRVAPSRSSSSGTRSKVPSPKTTRPASASYVNGCIGQDRG